MPPRWFAAALAFATLFSVSAGAKPRKPATPEVVYRPVFRIGTAEKAPERLQISGTVADAYQGFFGPGLKPELITLDDAIASALANNLEVKFDRVAVEIEKARKDFAFGVFDPSWTINVGRESTQRPDNTANLTSSSGIIQLEQIRAIQENTRAFQIATGQPITPAQDSATSGEVVVFDQDLDRYGTSLQARTPWGMRLALTAQQTKLRSTFIGDDRSITPQYSAFGGIEIQQPLLRGFGFDANLADVRTARVNQQVAEFAWQKQIADTVQQVLVAFTQMTYALQDIRVKEDAIAADRRLVTQNERRMDLGFISPIEVQQARVAVSIDEEALISSKFFFMEQQYRLKRLISKEVRENDRRVFIPRPVPALAVPVIDRSWAMRTAYQNRYDYRGAVAEAEVQDIRLRFAKNQLWPQLDVIGSYGYNGLSDNYRSARQEAYHTQAPQWTFGVQFSLPLGNVQSRAQVRAVQGFKEQALLKIKQTELTVSVDVDTVISRIETSRQRVETARQSRSLAEEAVRIANRRLEEGQISSFDVIETRKTLYAAQSREIAAHAELQTSITQYWLSTGTVLDRTGISFK